MARSLVQIEQDLAQLGQTTQRVADELYRVYRDYLVALGQAVGQQLVLVVYHICTQGYPEQFLACSVAQRQQLQAEIRRTAQQASGYLTMLLRKPRQPAEASPVSPSSTEKSSENQLLENQLPENQLPENQLPNDVLRSEAEELVTKSPESVSSERPTASSTVVTPMSLLQLQERIEQSIVEILRALSRKTNSLLREQAIAPDHFPEQLLEAAARSESPAPLGVPNLLSLVIEAVELPNIAADEESEQPAEAVQSNAAPLKSTPPALPIKVLAVNLRLSDLEFTSPQLVTYRNQIRALIVQLRQLDGDYRRIQQEKAIAEAEAAWHATWSVG